MAEFTLPALKRPKHENGLVVDEPYDPLVNDSWYRKVRIPVNKAILDTLKVGSNTKVLLTGKVVALESKQTEGKAERQELELELIAVSVPEGENEFSELADD